MNEKTINFTLSTTTNNDLKKYARYSNLKNPTCIRFFLSEQINNYHLHNEFFMKQWNSRHFQQLDTEGEHFKPYSFKIPIAMYDELMSMKKLFNVSLNELISNLIRNELDIIFQNYDKEFATLLKNISAEQYRSNISFSNVVKQDLINIAGAIGISLNALISHIILKYLIEHYDDYYSDIYADSEGKNYQGLW